MYKLLSVYCCSGVGINNVKIYMQKYVFCLPFQQYAKSFQIIIVIINPLNTEFNPICNLLTLLGAYHILHISRIKVKGQLLFFDIFLDKVKHIFLLRRELSQKKPYCNTQHSNGNFIKHTTDINKCLAYNKHIL